MQGFQTTPVSRYGTEKGEVLLKRSSVRISRNKKEKISRTKNIINKHTLIQKTLPHHQPSLNTDIRKVTNWLHDLVIEI